MTEENAAFIYAKDDEIVVTNDPSLETGGRDTDFWTIIIHYNEGLAVQYTTWRAFTWQKQSFRTAKEALDYVFE